MLPDVVLPGNASTQVRTDTRSHAVPGLQEAVAVGLDEMVVRGGRGNPPTRIISRYGKAPETFTISGAS